MESHAVEEVHVALPLLVASVIQMNHLGSIVKWLMKPFQQTIQTAQNKTGSSLSFSLSQSFFTYMEIEHKLVSAV